ncbi:MAG: hypothetical protein JNL95_03775 [Chitinophagales bacterium]|nr:hypothetical protein [Chitinophagales bacterium]
MNTTNLITDYLIIGIIGLFLLVCPIFMLIKPNMLFLLTFDVKNTAFWGVLLPVVTFGWGVIFNQIGDKVEDWILSLFSLKNELLNYEEQIKVETNFPHHYVLNFIVIKSETGYDYISFRRTMIRIVRSVVCLLFGLPILHLAFAVVLKVCFKLNIEFSVFNLFLCAASWVCSYFLTRGLLKLYNGYYAALSNFYLILSEKV